MKADSFSSTFSVSFFKVKAGGVFGEIEVVIMLWI